MTDIFQKITGTFGKYQLWIFLVISLSKFAIAYHQMAIIFLSPKVRWTCGDTNRMRCPCSNPVYNRTLFKNTIIMEWNLICGRRWLANFSQTLFQLGTLLGSIAFGSASDRFGRKWPMTAAVIVQVIFGVGAAFMPTYELFNFFRFVVGLTVGGTMVVGFVIVMEFAGTTYRDVISALYQVPFNLGHMMLPMFGYFVRDYKKFQLTVSLPTIILFTYICIIPETPRWLVAMKKTEKAIQILTRVAKVNKRPTENIRADVEAYQVSVEQHHLKKGTLIDIFRTPNMRKNMICMSLNWLACSYCFYGVSQYVGQLTGSVFFNVTTSAFVCTLGTLFSIPLLKFTGRKNIVIIFNYICTACLLVLALVPDGVGSIICSCIGVVSSFIVFVVVYLYCGEMFPTVVRNAAIGFCSMMARIGSMLAPFVIGMRETAKWMPPVGFAILPLIAGSTTFLLPETKGCELMTTLEEGEEFGKKRPPPSNTAAEEKTDTSS